MYFRLLEALLTNRERLAIAPMRSYTMQPTEDASACCPRRLLTPEYYRIHSQCDRNNPSLIIRRADEVLIQAGSAVSTCSAPPKQQATRRRTA